MRVFGNRCLTQFLTKEPSLGQSAWDRQTARTQITVTAGPLALRMGWSICAMSIAIICLGRINEDW